MGAIEYFEDLEAWKQAREFAKEICKLTEKESFAKEFLNSKDSAVEQEVNYIGLFMLILFAKASVKNMY